MLRGGGVTSETSKMKNWKNDRKTPLVSTYLTATVPGWKSKKKKKKKKMKFHRFS